MKRRSMPGQAVLSILSAIALGCGDGGGAAASPPPDRPRQLIVMVDLSGSRQEHMLAEGKRFLDELIGTLAYGEQVVLIEMHQGSATEDVRRWSHSIPALADPSFESVIDKARRDGARQAARDVAAEFFEGESRAARTDILSSLHIAAEYVRDAAGRSPVLYLLSDMLQSANGIEMEGLSRMPPADWARKQVAAGLLPRLDGACVVVVGADATTPNGLRVRKFWTEYFAAVGARLEPGAYRIIAPDAAAIRCR